uniref:Uncharacterized protein n=1 Tax=Rhizophora mucronata TaxID=61149 RepID=A0A2P2P4F7_RHIMU
MFHPVFHVLLLKKAMRPHAMVLPLNHWQSLMTDCSKRNPSPFSSAV